MVKLPKRYTQIDCLPSGGFSDVICCMDNHLERKVAIKEFFKSGFSRKGSRVIVPPDFSNDEFEENKQRYLDEARQLGKFNNPNIVKIFDFFEANNTCYIIMEFIDGESIQEHISKNGPYN